VKDIGLWGEGVRKAFADMGAIEFADIDSQAVLEQDQRVAEEFDAGRFVREALAEGGSLSHRGRGSRRRDAPG
jgi:hypothetical protein